MWEGILPKLTQQKLEVKIKTFWKNYSYVGLEAALILINRYR